MVSSPPSSFFDFFTALAYEHAVSQATEKSNCEMKKLVFLANSVSHLSVLSDKCQYLLK